jgi:xanthine dehydrogenase YagR molybdenum-binding subunit
MAARELRRPVKVVYTGTQTFTGHRHRPYTIQKLALGAERSAELSAMIHEMVHNTSTFEEFSDDVGSAVHGAAMAVAARLLSLANRKRARR